ncbi:hypothetical protein FX982_02421 [Pseudomonas graminis]|jgi:hypothetical protein|uniref:Uncharacterized protein n=1 Tax=Pseudomonas graminis TaxID=158627 RepID=A0A6M8MKC6_9PSED|nr:hypothetical protein FX982_02421 [Pseudomonas graminis]
MLGLKRGLSGSMGPHNKSGLSFGFLFEWWHPLMRTLSLGADIQNVTREAIRTASTRAKRRSITSIYTVPQMRGGVNWGRL